MRRCWSQDSWDSDKREVTIMNWTVSSVAVVGGGDLESGVEDAR